MRNSKLREVMMDKMIGYCGVDCSKCVPYIAKKENNDDLRKQYADEQSKFFFIFIPPEHINCDGCRSEGEHFGFCSVCEIRRCCQEKNIENCAYCDDYICEELKKVYSVMCEVFGKGTGNVADAQITLDEIRKKL
jgi:hypothetical protein